MSTPVTLSRRHEIALLVASGLILSLFFVRAQVAFDPFPAWSGDPTLMPAPIASLTPATSALIDVVILSACVVIFFLAPAAPPLWITSLVLLGGLTIVFRKLFDPITTLDDMITGLPWIGAVTGACALAFASRVASVRSLVLACLWAPIVGLAAKSFFQYFIEHPANVEMFRATKQQFFDSQGWSPDSAMARAYERRLLQPEGTAWFGLSNVLATFGAACFAGFTAVLASREDSPHARASWTKVGLWMGLIASLIVLLLTKSKGGWAVAAIGVGYLTLSNFSTRFPATHNFSRLWSVLSRHAAILVSVGILAAITFRGMIGERISELSLLFRWFYIQAATQIFFDAPTFGVGAGGFKDAYLVFKNARSPEEVASPHSILFDWIAPLGLGGVCWCIAWLVAISALFRCKSQPIALEPAPLESSLRDQLRPIFLVLACGSIVGTLLEQQVSGPEAVLVRFIAIFGGTLVAGAVACIVNTSAFRLGLAACALVAIAHSHMELTPSNPSSVGWVLLLTVGGGCWTSACASDINSKRKARNIVPAALCLVLCLGAMSQAIRLKNWETPLRRAAALVEQLPDLQSRRNELARSQRQVSPTVANELLSDIQAARGLANPPSRTDQNIGEQIDTALTALRFRQLSLADMDLDRAAKLEPSHFETRRAEIRLFAQIVAMADPSEAPLLSELKNREAAVLEYCKKYGRSSAWSWLALMYEQRAQGGFAAPSAPAIPPGQLVDQEAAIAALDAWKSALALSSNDPNFANRAALWAQRMGLRDEAARLARLALDSSERLSLDPLKKLTGDQERTLRNLLAK